VFQEKGVSGRQQQFIEHCFINIDCIDDLQNAGTAWASPETKNSIEQT